MFQKFKEFFGVEKQSTRCLAFSPYQMFIKQFGGKQFGQGMFNAFTEADINKMAEIVFKAFPQFSNRSMLFGYDWLGRIFGITKKNGKEIVLLFEIGSMDVLEIPCDFLTFLNNEIPNCHEACLASTYFNNWKTVGNPPQYGRCIGYKIPLFLGGKDIIENLEDSDLEVYWYIMSSIIGK